MNDKNSSGQPRFYVTQSGFGFEEGIYTQEELKSLPKSTHPYVISLAVAESMGYVTLDHKPGKSLNELDAFAAPDIETGKIKKLRGVLEGTLDAPIHHDNLPPKKVGNALRDLLQNTNQKSAEDSLKAQIAAKKKELNSI